MADYDGLQSAIVEWADSISPLRQPKDAVVKLVSESSELLDAVLNKNRRQVAGELADVFFLLLDLADMYKLDLAEETWFKLNVNRERKWIEENGVIRRIK